MNFSTTKFENIKKQCKKEKFKLLVAPNENPDGFDAGVVAVVVGVEVVLLPPPKLNPPVVGFAVVVVVEAAEAPVAAPPPKENAIHIKQQQL